VYLFGVLVELEVDLLVPKDVYQRYLVVYDVVRLLVVLNDVDTVSSVTKSVLRSFIPLP
jgi:hypothetical protein